jgi:hypothetical protein
MAGLPDVGARLRRADDRLHFAAFGHIRPQHDQALLPTPPKKDRLMAANTRRQLLPGYGTVKSRCAARSADGFKRHRKLQGA